MGVLVSCHLVSTAEIVMHSDNKPTKALILPTVCEHTVIVAPLTNGRNKSGHSSRRRGSRIVSDISSPLPAIPSPLSTQSTEVAEGGTARHIAFDGTIQSDSIFTFRLDGVESKYDNPLDLGMMVEDRRTSVCVYHSTTPILQRVVCTCTFDGETLTSQDTWPEDPACSGGVTMSLELATFNDFH